jgi:hypothetical protein
MWPFLRGKEKLIIRKVSISDLKLGDLMLYKADKNVICHRLVKKARDKNRYIIYARGDASLGSPEPVKEEMFLGKVIGVVKNNKIIYYDGPKQRFINRIILVVLPLINFMGKVYAFLFVRR